MAGNRVFTPEFRVAAAQRILNGESVSVLSAELRVKRGFCPGCRISIKPSTRCCRNRSFQRAMVGAVVSRRSWIARYGTPSASIKISREQMTQSRTLPAGEERHGFECYRHGTLSLYAALDVRSGKVHGKTATRHLILVESG